MRDQASDASSSASPEPHSDWAPTFDALRDQATWLHAKWLESRKLYAHSPQRIELLRGTAGFFFHVVQDVLWDDVVLGLAWNTDAPEDLEG